MTPDDPRHGTRAGYLAHRKADQDPCTPCSAAHTRHCKEYRHRTHTFAQRVRIPAAEVLEIINRANAAGISDYAFARAAGLSNSAIGRMRAKYSAVNPATMQKVRNAIDNLTLPPGSLVEASLTQERVKSMMAQGYARKWIIHETGWIMPTDWLTCKRVRYTSAVAVRDLAMRLGDRRGPSKMTATWAAKSDWKVAAAWDDPGTVTWPVGWREQHEEPISLIDDSAIERRINGDRSIRLHKGEPEEVVRRMLAAGHTGRQINLLTGIKVERYAQVAA